MPPVSPPASRLSQQTPGLRLIIPYYVSNRTAEKPLEVSVSGFSSFWSPSGKGTRNGGWTRPNFINAAAGVKPPAGEPPPA